MRVASWVEVGRIEDVPPGHAARVEIGDVPVAIFNVDGEFFCIDDTCTHAEPQYQTSHAAASLLHSENAPQRWSGRSLILYLDKSMTSPDNQLTSLPCRRERGLVRGGRNLGSIRKIFADRRIS